MSLIQNVEFIKFRWSHSCDMNGFIYQTGWAHEMYIEAIPTKPKYSINKTGIEDVNGSLILTNQRMDKTYNLHLLLREYQLDALVFASIHSEVIIYLRDGSKYVVRSMAIQEPNWDKYGSFAEVDIDFTLDPVVTTACCTNETLIDKYVDEDYSWLQKFSPNITLKAGSESRVEVVITPNKLPCFVKICWNEFGFDPYNFNIYELKSKTTINKNYPVLGYDVLYIPDIYYEVNSDITIDSVIGY